MRKFTVLLLAVAFVIGFTMTASAADVKLSGQYYVKGLYEKNHALNAVAGTEDKALSLTHQRLRVQPEVEVASGLKLVMRFDALERAWGDKTWAGASVDTASRTSQGVAGVNVQENIEFERAYVDFNTGIGKFMVGYQNFAAWGTSFGDTALTRPGVKYIVPVGDFVFLALFEKGAANYAVTTKTPDMDKDQDILDLGVIYKLSNGEAGLLYQYVRTGAYRGVSQQNDSPVHVNALLPYYKGTFGSVAFETEGLWARGRGLTNGASYFDRDAEGYGLYAKANVDIAPVYVGGVFAYMSGDDNTTTKIEGGLATALLYGQTWSPMVMMWNDQFITWTGGYAGKNGTAMNQFFDNAMLLYFYGGFKPTEKWDIKAAFAYAKADQDVVANQISKDIGMEFDVVGTYSIYSNLQYEVGLGYFMPGDFFKGSDTAASLGNDYLLYNKLTLNF